MRTESREHEGTAVDLFGASAERTEFERSARDRADEPQTAPLLITTFIPTITITICAAC